MHFLELENTIFQNFTLAALWILGLAPPIKNFWMRLCLGVGLISDQNPAITKFGRGGAEGLELQKISRFNSIDGQSKVV